MKKQRRAVVQADALVEALVKHEHLELRFDRWKIGRLEVTAEAVDALWPEVVEALRRTGQRPAVTHVVFEDDAHYEAPTFLAELTAMAQLVLYGNTLIDDLSALADHPSLKRLALTNYCGLYRAEQYAVLDTIAGLEEIILFGEYLDLYEPVLGEATLGRLRSLWTSWDVFGMIPAGSMPRLERLTLTLQDEQDVLELLGEDVDPSERLTDALMRARLATLADGGWLRLLHWHEQSWQGRAEAEAVFARWLPEGARITHHWQDQQPTLMDLASRGDAFLGGRSLLGV